MAIEQIIKEYVSSNRSSAYMEIWIPVQDSEAKRIIVGGHEIESWKWTGMPYSVRFKNKPKYPQIMKIVDYQIQQASSVECVTSSISYIRECKKWYMKREKEKNGLL